jgi:hypothetical protein
MMENRIDLIIIRNRAKTISLQTLFGRLNNSGTAKVKIVKNERDPPLFTGKLLIKFQNILRNTTQDSFFPRSMNLSTADLRNYRTEFHETWWSYRYIFLVDPKVFRFVVKGVKAIFLVIKFQNILRNTTQVIIRHRVKILFSIISSPTRYDYNLMIMKSPRVIKSPKQRLETYCFCSVSYYY